MHTRLKIRAYKRLSPRVFERLYWDFTFPDGSSMRPALDENRMLYILVAYYDKKIVGWAGVYRGFYGFDDDEKYSMGVFVCEKFRHCGVGGKLKRKTMLWAMRHRPNTVWYDGKNQWMCLPVAIDYTGVSRELDERRMEQAIG